MKAVAGYRPQVAVDFKLLSYVCFGAGGRAGKVSSMKKK